MRKLLALEPDSRASLDQMAKHAWLNGGLAARTNVKSECVAKTVGAPVTHDNLYHTVLGMMDVTSVTYQPTLDIFDACRTEG